MALLKSWVESANSATIPFPLNNLPYGVFSFNDSEQHCGVAIGDMILDVTGLEKAHQLGLFGSPVFDVPFWNGFMELGPETWQRFRNWLTDALSIESTLQGMLEPFSIPKVAATMHMPFAILEYTGFYAGRHHATNVGTMFRGAGNALPPNWLHIPIGYNGRASSVVVAGTPVRRPWGN